MSWAWWYTTITSAFGRLRQEGRMRGDENEGYEGKGREGGKGSYRL